MAQDQGLKVEITRVSFPRGNKETKVKAYINLKVSYGNDYTDTYPSHRLVEEKGRFRLEVPYHQSVSGEGGKVFKENYHYPNKSLLEVMKAAAIKAYNLALADSLKKQEQAEAPQEG